MRKFSLIQRGTFKKEGKGIYFLIGEVCRKNYAKEIIPAIQEFVEKPYYLQEYSELEKVPKAKKRGYFICGSPL